MEGARIVGVAAAPLKLLKAGKNKYFIIYIRLKNKSTSQKINVIQKLVMKISSPFVAWLNLLNLD